MKIAIVVGHTSKLQGAVRRADGVTEFVWNSDLADKIKQIGGETVGVFFRDPSLGGRAGILRAYRAADDWGADCAIGLHFNSHGDPDAEGAETLSSGSVSSRALCDLLQSAMVRALDARDRGVKVRKAGERGAISLLAGRAPAAIVEPYFGSNPERAKIADARKDDLARAIYDAAASFVRGRAA